MEPIKDRTKFTEEVGDRMRGLEGVHRVAYDFSEGPCQVLVVINADGLPEEIQGVLARLRLRYGFGLRCVPNCDFTITPADEYHSRRPPIWAVGVAESGVSSVHAALINLSERLWGEQEIENFTVDPEKGSGFDWGARFTVDGTSMKAAGTYYEGSVRNEKVALVTWWK